MSRILLIYTGGTIGSVLDPIMDALVPLDFSEIDRHVPELGRLGHEIVSESIDRPIDSSNVTPAFWTALVELLASNYEAFDGFVILHGTDTLAYTASALSYMLEGLHKPVVLTGSQLPIGVPRTDGRENLVTAVEIAALTYGDLPAIQEVTVYFGSTLFRGNRTQKASAESFNAFESPNFPPLAEAGVELDFHPSNCYQGPVAQLKPHTKMDPNVIWLPLFPGQSPTALAHCLSLPELRGAVLSTFGSGNAPTDPALREVLMSAYDRGLILVNVTQCSHGSVHPERYATAHLLRDCGVIPGGDMTPEAALTKLMFLLGLYGDTMAEPEARDAMLAAIRENLVANLRGERTNDSPLPGA
jgi:L-asparaginase